MKKMYADLFRYNGVMVADEMLPTSGTRNQWKRDTKGTHRRGIPVQTPPYRGSIRQDKRNARSQPLYPLDSVLPIGGL